MGKKLVLCKNSSKLATSRKVKTFFGSMGDTYKGPRNFKNCKRVQENATQERVPQRPHMGQEQATLTQVERENILKKGATQETDHQEGECLSNILLAERRDGGNYPMVNLKYLNQFIPYQHFEMEICFAPANYYKREITCASLR